MKKTYGVCFLLIGLLSNLDAQAIQVDPYLQDAEPTSIVVSWETDGGISGSVQWGTEVDDLSQSQAAGSIPTAGGDRLFTAKLLGLNPVSRYYYRVITDGTSSQVYDFITPPLPTSEQSFNIVAMSDMQIDGSHPLKFQEVVHDGIFDYFEAQHGEDDIAEHLGLVMIPGDLVSNGNNHSQWQNDFFGQANPLFAHVPVYPVLGNHENNSNFYFQYFSLPENGSAGFLEHWWYKDYSNVRIIGLNSNGGFRIQEQLDWLDGVLDAACQEAHIDFVFAQLHHPFRSELWTPGELDYTGDVISRLEDFSTDCGKPSIHFFGHTHGYSRGQSQDHTHLWVNAATAGGAIDNWGEFPNQDYEEFSRSIDEYGFVVLNVVAGNDPQFVLRRITRGDQDGSIDNEQQDVITILRNQSPPQVPIGLFPSGGGVNPDCFIMQANAFNDAGDFHQASQWQVSTDCQNFSAPLIDSWKQHENVYAETDTQAGDDLTNEEGGGLQGASEYCWRVRYRDEHLKWSEWSSPVAFSTSTSNNLLSNPGGENGTTGWSAVGSGSIESLADGECAGESPRSGNYYFAVGGLCDGNETAFSEAVQLVDVTGFSADIDAGGLSAIFGGYLSNFSGSDRPAMQLDFLDASASSLGSSLELSTTNDPWTLLEESVAIPVSCRTIRVVLTGTRNAGVDNDSYFDDLFLRVGSPNDGACSEIALPVEFLSVETVCRDRFNELSWQVAEEEDVREYLIERSNFQEEWQQLGRLAPSSATALIKRYQYRDFDRVPGQQYHYRIKIVEADGHYHYSPIVADNCSSLEPEITAYPNPLIGDRFLIDIDSPVGESVRVSITNLLGQEVYGAEEQINSGDNTIAIPADQLSAGYYLISISNMKWQWTTKMARH